MGCVIPIHELGTHGTTAARLKSAFVLTSSYDMCQTTFG